MSKAKEINKLSIKIIHERSGMNVERQLETCLIFFGFLGYEKEFEEI